MIYHQLKIFKKDIVRPQQILRTSSPKKDFCITFMGKNLGKFFGPNKNVKRLDKIRSQMKHGNQCSVLKTKYMKLCQLMKDMVQNKMTELNETFNVVFTTPSRPTFSLQQFQT